ncbi:hypothetical protein LCGC14_1539430, partial [marine sediment metagenome]
MTSIFKMLTVCFCLFGLSNSPEKFEKYKPQIERPNILFIAVDDLRNELGIYGSIAKSPHLDALAKEGILFTHHYVQVPTCGASRHALL